MQRFEKWTLQTTSMPLSESDKFFIKKYLESMVGVERESLKRFPGEKWSRASVYRLIIILQYALQTLLKVNLAAVEAQLLVWKKRKYC